MNLYCTRPHCPKPTNFFADLDHSATLRSVAQKYCTACGMPLILAGRYLTTRLLGQGGFGAAFLARDRYTPAQRLCVVKQFLPSGKLTPAQLQVAQELFEREAEVLESLGNAHPQIPDLFAFFELTVPGFKTSSSDKFFYLVQEYIDGKTLEDLLTEQGAFAATTVWELLTEILSVLEFVHEHGSIHRDIKPSNIIQHRNGRYYLLDFGAVKQATKGNATRSTGIYSAGFAPPEQVSGNQVFPSTDLYALAVTCVMLLTGKQPEDLYDGYSNRWQWRSHVPQVDDALADVLDRMLEAAPSDRFQTAAAALEALQQGKVASQAGRQRSVNPASVNPAAGSPPVPPPAAQPMPARPTSPPIAHPPTSIQPATPAPIQPTPAAPAPRQRARSVAPFSTLELLLGAGFTGLQAGLLAIVLLSLLGTTLLTAGFWLLLLVGLILLQWRRVIERVDLVLIAIGSLAAVLLIGQLRQTALISASGNPLLAVLVVAGLMALLAIAITSLFRLIYNLISRSP